jgi:hypothetical protein
MHKVPAIHRPEARLLAARRTPSPNRRENAAVDNRLARSNAQCVQYMGYVTLRPTEEKIIW